MILINVNVNCKVREKDGMEWNKMGEVSMIKNYNRVNGYKLRGKECVRVGGG